VDIIIGEIKMPRTPTIFFNSEEWEKLKKKAEDENYPSMYAYMKDLIIKELRKPVISSRKA